MDGLQGLLTPPLPRRGFVMTGLIAGFTLATERVDAQAIHTDSHGLVAGEMQVPVADGQLPGYFARPQGPGPFPTVLVVEEIFGVHEYIKDTCRRLAKLGYLAATAELYARLGDLSKMTDMSQIMGVISRAPDATVMTDLDSVAAWAFANEGDPKPARHHRFLPRWPGGVAVCRAQPRAEGGGGLVWPDWRHPDRHPA